MPRVYLAAGPLRAGARHRNRVRITGWFHPLPGPCATTLTLSHISQAPVFWGGLPQRDLPTRTKRKLHAIGGARGLWSLPVRTAVKVNGVPYDRPANPFYSENDSLILGTDVIPSPGFSRVRISPPLSLNTAIDLTRMRGSLAHALPRGTLRSRPASRGSLLVPHHSSKARQSFTCYQMPSGCSSRVRCANLIYYVV